MLKNKLEKMRRVLEANPNSKNALKILKYIERGNTFKNKVGAVSPYDTSDDDSLFERLGSLFGNLAIELENPELEQLNADFEEECGDLLRKECPNEAKSLYLKSFIYHQTPERRGGISLKIIKMGDDGLLDMLPRDKFRYALEAYEYFRESGNKQKMGRTKKILSDAIRYFKLGEEEDIRKYKERIINLGLNICELKKGSALEKRFIF